MKFSTAKRVAAVAAQRRSLIGSSPARTCDDSVATTTEMHLRKGITEVSRLRKLFVVAAAVATLTAMATSSALAAPAMAGNGTWGGRWRRRHMGHRHHGRRPHVGRTHHRVRRHVRH